MSTLRSHRDRLARCVFPTDKTRAWDSVHAKLGSLSLMLLVSGRSGGWRGRLDGGTGVGVLVVWDSEVPRGLSPGLGDRVRRPPPSPGRSGASSSGI